MSNSKRQATDNGSTIRGSTIGAGELELGLYNQRETDPDAIAGATLALTGNGANLLPSPEVSLSPITDLTLDLGALATTESLQLDLRLTLRLDAVGAGLFLDVLPGDALAPGASEPPALAANSQAAAYLFAHPS